MCFQPLSLSLSTGPLLLCLQLSLVLKPHSPTTTTSITLDSLKSQTSVSMLCTLSLVTLVFLHRLSFHEQDESSEDAACGFGHLLECELRWLSGNNAEKAGANQPPVHSLCHAAAHMATSAFSVLIVLELEHILPESLVSLGFTASTILSGFF